MTIGLSHRYRSGRGKERLCQAGFSLAEMVAVMIIMSVLVIAMGSAMVLASKAIPRGTDQNALVIEASRVSDQIVEELRTAKYLTERAVNAMTLTVADRNGDGLPETIRYAWSGTAGDPLTMQLNGGALITVLDNIQQFDLTYDKMTSIETYPGPIVESAESELISNDSLTNFSDTQVKNDYWLGEYFELATLPPDTISWKVKRVIFKAKQEGSVSGGTDVQLRLPTTNNLPSSTVVDQFNFLESDLTTTLQWHQVSFMNAGGLSPTQGLCLVFTSTDTVGTSRIEYQSGSATLLNSALVDSNDQGGTWTDYADKALQFYVYGTYTAPAPDQAVTREHVSAVRIALHAGDDPNSRVETAARLLNLPEILTAVWEADFNADPTLLDIENDANPDWDMTGGGSFDPVTLANGVWQVDQNLRTMPDYDFTEITTIDLRFRDTDQGGAGPYANIYVDFGGGQAGIIGVRVKLSTNGFQYVNVSFGPGPTVSVIEDVVIEGPLPPGEFADVRLLIDPVKDTFNVRINGQDKGTFAYPRFSLPNGMFYMDQGGAGSEIDYVRVRVGGTGS